MSISLRVLGVLLAAVPVLPAYAQTETPTPSITPKIIKVIQEGKSTQTMNTAVSTAAVTAGKTSQNPRIANERAVFFWRFGRGEYLFCSVVYPQPGTIKTSIHTT